MNQKKYATELHINQLLQGDGPLLIQNPSAHLYGLHDFDNNSDNENLEKKQKHWFENSKIRR